MGQHIQITGAKPNSTCWNVYNITALVGMLPVVPCVLLLLTCTKPRNILGLKHARNLGLEISWRGLQLSALTEVFPGLKNVSRSEWMSVLGSVLTRVCCHHGVDLPEVAKWSAMGGKVQGISLPLHTLYWGCKRRKRATGWRRTIFCALSKGCPSQMSTTQMLLFWCSSGIVNFANMQGCS